MHGRALLTLAVLAACAITLLPLAGATTHHHHHHHHHGKTHHHHHRRAGSRIGERPCKCCDIDPENYNACPCRNEGACPRYRRLLAEEPAQQHGGQVPQQEAEELVGVWKMEEESMEFFEPGLTLEAIKNANGQPDVKEIFNAGSDREKIKGDLSSDKTNVTFSFLPTEIVILGGNVTTGFWAGLVVERNEDKAIRLVHTLHGFMSEVNNDILLAGNGGMPGTELELVYHPETKLMDLHVRQTHKAKRKKGTDFVYLVQAVLKKADGQLEETLKEASAFLKEKDSKGGEAGGVESSD